MKLLSSAALALGIGLLSGSASAAPVGSVNDLRSALPDTSAVQTVQYGPRRCWRRYDGALVCRRIVREYGYYDDRYYQPYYGRGYGYDPGPGIGLYFGGGRHRHW
jgi:hypothetical protein